MVVVAQLVRAPDCGSGGRRFEPGLPPKIKGLFFRPFFVSILSFKIIFTFDNNYFNSFTNPIKYYKMKNYLKKSKLSISSKLIRTALTSNPPIGLLSQSFMMSADNLSSQFNAGSSNYVIPRSSLSPFGFGIFKKASTSPTAGT